MTERADPPELAKAIALLREIYWREYVRGWRAAIDVIKKGLEQLPSCGESNKQPIQLAESPPCEIVDGLNNGV